MFTEKNNTKSVCNKKNSTYLDRYELTRSLKDLKGEKERERK